jgi:hypothetical protein
LGTRADILEYCVDVIPKYPEKRGKYVFRFYKEGKWVNVSIDDRLPCDANGKLVFAHCLDPNEIVIFFYNYSGYHCLKKHMPSYLDVIKH